MLIAEIGINHKGNEKRAFKMLKELARTGIDAVTFQVLPPKSHRENRSFGKPLERKFYSKAIDFAHKNNKLIGFAICDIKMVPFLSKSGADFWKVMSTSISSDTLIKRLVKTGRLLFLSTGISDEREIIKVGKKFKNITFIHTQLSHQIEDINLRAIGRLRKVTGREIAFGLHCPDLHALYLSVAFEPSDLFFYVKDNKRGKFMDDEHAILINRVDKVIKRLKDMQKALGTGIKKKAGIKIE